jgi:hypothetical protein
VIEPAPAPVVPPPAPDPGPLLFDNLRQLFTTQVAYAQTNTDRYPKIRTKIPPKINI